MPIESKGYLYTHYFIPLELTDTNIMVGLRDGNEKVFEMIFKTYYERLCNYANAILHDIDEAEEMVQSAFLAVWEKHDTIDIHSSMKSYLYQAVHNRCLNRVKHYKVRKEHSNHIKNQTDTTLTDASQELIGSELEILTQSAINSLPQQCQTVFRLSRFENLSYAEIAQQLNISVKTVENHMGKALKTLREILKEYLPLLIWLMIVRN